MEKRMHQTFSKKSLLHKIDGKIFKEKYPQKYQWTYFDSIDDQFLKFMISESEFHLGNIVLLKNKSNTNVKRFGNYLFSDQLGFNFSNEEFVHMIGDGNGFYWVNPCSNKLKMIEDIQKMSET